MNITTHENILPLSPQVLQILVALASGRSTGYELMRQVKEDTDGRMVVMPGTLYPALQRLLKLHHIKECEDGFRLRPGQSVRLYELTPVGEQTLEWELERLEKAAELGRGRLSDRWLRRDVQSSQG